MISAVPVLKKLLVVVLISLLAACGGSAERKAKYMKEGKQLFEAGDYEKAQLSFKNVLQIDPKDAEARYQMAETLSKLGEIQPAVSQYLAVTTEDSKHLMSRVRMGQIYLLFKKLDDAEKMANEVKAIDANHVEGMLLMAGIFASKNNIDGAMAQINTALKQEPDNVQGNLLLATLTASNGKLDQAISIIQKNSEKNPTNPSPLLMLSKLYHETKAPDKVQQVLEKLITIEPKQLEHRKRLATFLIAENRLDDAENVYRQAAKDLADTITAKSALISFLVAKRSPEKAVAELQPMIEQNPSQYDLRFMLAELQLTQKQTDKAEETLKTIADLDKLGPQSIKARNKLARLYVINKRTDEAKALIAKIIEENPRDSDALSLRGEFALAEHQLPEAIGDFRAVLVDQPQNIRILKLLSRTYILNNDRVLARENMEKVVEIAPADEAAQIELASLLQQSGDSDRALQHVSAALKAKPDSRAGLDAAFKIYVTQKQWDKAQETANQLQTAFPKEGMGYFLSGMAYKSEGKLDNSIAAFEKSLEVQPEAVEPLTQLINTYVGQKQSDKALGKLNAVIKQQPKNFVAYNLSGIVYLSDKKYDEAGNAFKKAISIKADWPIPYRMLALTYSEQGKKAEAIKSYQDGIAKTDDAKLLVNELANMYHRDGEHQKAIALFEEIYKRHPDSMEALNNLASYLTDFSKEPKDLDRAAKLAETLAKSNDPNQLDTVGWIAFKQGDYAKAQALFEKVIAAAPESAINNYHLGMTYYQQKNTAKAREHLQKAIDKKADFIGLATATETLKLLDGKS